MAMGEAELALLSQSASLFDVSLIWDCRDGLGIVV